MSPQPQVSRSQGVSDAEWQALVMAVRDMAEKVAGLSRRMAAMELRWHRGVGEQLHHFPVAQLLA
jgi:hypothetical protein